MKAIPISLFQLRFETLSRNLAAILAKYGKFLLISAIFSC